MAQIRPISIVEHTEDVWDIRQVVALMTVTVLVKCKLLQVWEIADFTQQPVVGLDCSRGHASIEV